MAGKSPAMTKARAMHDEGEVLKLPIARERGAQQRHDRGDADRGHIGNDRRAGRNIVRYVAFMGQVRQSERDRGADNPT